MKSTMTLINTLKGLIKKTDKEIKLPPQEKIDALFEISKMKLAQLYNLEHAPESGPDETYSRFKIEVIRDENNRPKDYRFVYLVRGSNETEGASNVLMRFDPFSDELVYHEKNPSKKKINEVFQGDSLDYEGVKF